VEEEEEERVDRKVEEHQEGAIKESPSPAVVEPDKHHRTITTLCIIVRGVEDFSTESNSFTRKNSKESQSPKPFHPSASV